MEVREQIRVESYRGTKEDPLWIGRKGEKIVRTAVFTSLPELREVYGPGLWEVVVERPDERGLAYIASEVWESAEGYACWDLSDADVSIAGYGRVELRYYPESEDSKVYKTQVYVTKIDESISGDAGVSPNPYQDYIEELIRLKQEIDAFNAKFGNLEEFIADTIGSGVLTIKKNGVDIGTFSANEKNDKSINIEADKQVQTDWNDSDSTSVSFIKNKPTIGSGVLTIQKNGQTVGNFSANSTSDSTINIEADKQVQTDWNEVDTSNVSFIKNKPYIPQIASDVGAIPMSAKGAAGGVAELDSEGKVPAAQLPSFVDDVLEFATRAAFPVSGESGKIYVDTSTNLTYRWSGSSYVEISESLALGETSSTAYRGDRGKIAYDYAVGTHSYNDLIDKPTIGNGILTIQKNGTNIGTFNANATGNTTINIEADKQVQADWNESDTMLPSFVKNKPIIGNGQLSVVRKNETLASFTANQVGASSLDLSDFGEMRRISLADYNALTAAEKNSDIVWYIYDAPQEMANVITLSKAEYNALSQTEKENGLFYYVYDDDSVASTVVSHTYEDNTSSVPDSKLLYDVHEDVETLKTDTSDLSDEVTSVKESLSTLGAEVSNITAIDRGYFNFQSYGLNDAIARAAATWSDGYYWGNFVISGNSMEIMAHRYSWGLSGIVLPYGSSTAYRFYCGTASGSTPSVVAI